MNYHEAIAQAQTVADEAGYEWTAVVRVTRLRFWPWRKVWRVSSCVADEETLFTIVFIDDETERSRIHRVRPWRDYETMRLAIFPLLLLVAMGVLTTVIFRIFGFFSIDLSSSGMTSLIAAILAGSTVFSIPLLRFLGKDDWFLRPELRDRVLDKRVTEKGHEERSVGEDEGDERQEVEHAVRDGDA